MLSTIRITNPQNGQTTLVLQLHDRSPESPYIVKSITGLTDVDLGLYMADMGENGSTYRGRRTQKRNIVINLKLQPDWMASRDLQYVRDQLYRIFLPARPESNSTNSAGYGSYFGMLLYDSEPGVPIKQIGKCYVEKIDIDIFSKEPSAMISIIAPDPMIYNAVATWYEHPEGTTGFDFGVLGHTGDGVRMSGLMVHGLADYFSFTAFEPAGAYTIMAVHEESSAGYLFYTGDYIDVDTRPGYRKIVRRRPTLGGGWEFRDITHLLIPSSTWITTRLGANGIGTWAADRYGEVADARLCRFEYYDVWWTA
jgi:hypothetical protein